MRVLIVTAGSRGDVAPFTGLGQRLQQPGMRSRSLPTDGSPTSYADVGWSIVPCRYPVDMVRERTAAPSPEAGLAGFSDFLHRTGEGLVAATEVGAHLIITAYGPGAVSRLVAEGFGIPSIGGYLVPSVPTAEFPLPRWPVPGDLGPAGNLAAGRELLGRAGALNAQVLPRLRAQLCLPATTATPADGKPPAGWSIFHGFSPTVVRRPADWPVEVQVPGYWWPAWPGEWQPQDDLLDFLRAGPPPVADR